MRSSPLRRRTALHRVAALSLAGVVVAAAAAGLKAPVIDGTFGAGGLAHVDVGGIAGDDSADDVAEDRRGRPLVIVHRFGQQFTKHLVRFTALGTLDTSFDGDGEMDLTALGHMQKVAVDGQGRIVVAGNGGTPAGLRVLRFSEEGVPDAGFGANGVADVAFVRPGGAVTGLLIDSQDRVVVCVNTTYVEGLSNLRYESRIARLTAAGVADPAFGGGDGIVEGAPLPEVLTAIAFDGAKILACGPKTNSGSRFQAFRFLEDGTPDANFGTGGVAEWSDSNRWFGDVEGVAPDAQGGVVICGRWDAGFDLSNDDDVALVRFTPGGAIDTTFGDGGLLVFDPSRGGYERFPRLAVEDGGAGDFVVSGESDGPGRAEGWYVAEIPQGGGKPKLFFHRFSENALDVRPRGQAFARGGSYLVAGIYEDNRAGTTGSDTFVARVRLTPFGPADLTAAWTKDPTQKCAAEGAPCTVKGGVSVANLGGTTSGKAVAAIFLSADDLLDAGDTRIGQIALPPIAPGGAAKLNVKVKSDVPAAGRRVLVVVDETGVVAEKDETNQVAASAAVP